MAFTSEHAADKAAETLDQAREIGLAPKRVSALVGVADGWTRLYAAMAAAADRVGDPEMTIREEEINGIDVVVVPEKARKMLVALGWIPPG